MNKDKFELNRLELDIITLLRIIDAEPEKNIKTTDLESRHGAMFKRMRIDDVILSALKQNLIINKKVTVGKTRSIMIALTEAGAKYISLVC